MGSRNGARTVSWAPLGIGHTKPRHYLEMLKVAWDNRDALPYAWRILTHGVCDGCSLGPKGLRDDAMDGVHLCMSRLKLLRLNTMPAMREGALSDVEALRKLDGRALRRLGRLPHPMIRRKGERGFSRLSWDEAAAVAGKAIAAAAPTRFALYTTSRGLTNEIYYAASKFARLAGTNNIDNAARLCHAASTTGLKATVGVAATTNSYKDWIDTDLLVLFGTHVANNQPVAVKYFHYAKEKGARIAVVNPYREPALERYWIPSITKSALFGTRLMDDFFPVNTGGDIAFINGVLKVLIDRGWVDASFVADHTEGFEALRAELAGQSWEDLEARSGTGRDDMIRFAEMYAGARRAVFMWSMGLTQHVFGVENVKAVVNLALARGMIGRQGCGLAPVRGHSGVQGAAEVGSVPNAYAAGMPVNEENARRLEEIWGHPVPRTPGLTAPEMLDAAHSGRLDAFYVVGGNFLDTLPDPAYVRGALEKVRCLIFQDIVATTAMLVDPADTIVLLPAQTRYEQPGGGTVTSTERRIRFSPEIPGPRPAEARCEWQIISLLARHALGGDAARLVAWKDVWEIIGEMERVVPIYKGVSNLGREGDSIQHGGKMLLEGGVCPGMPGGRARFTPLQPPAFQARDGDLRLTTRRGQQFNSIIWKDADPLTGGRRRDEILISARDAGRFSLADGDRIRLANALGEFEGVARIAPIQPGSLQAYWPEVNHLIPRRVDPGSREPDYNAAVRVEKIST